MNEIENTVAEDEAKINEIQQQIQPVDAGNEPEAVAEDETKEKPPESGKPDAAAVKQKPWFMRRIESLEQQIDRERASQTKALDIIEKMGRAKPEAEAEPTAAAKRPALAEYESYADYNEALIEWKFQERVRADDERRGQEAQRGEQERDQQSAKERIDSARKAFAAQQAAFEARTPDYHEKVMSVRIPASESMMFFMAETGRGPDILYHLAGNPDEAAKIYDMPHYNQALVIGRLAATLPGGESQPGNAPPAPPSAPIKGSGSGGETPSDNDDTEGWLKKERERLRKKYGPQYRGY